MSHDFFNFDQEGRQAWARRGGERVHIDETDRGASGLHCPDPECSRPMRVNSGQVKRSYFSHVPDPDYDGCHGIESGYHLDAKTFLAAWAAEQPGVVETHVERSLGNRAIIADALVTFDEGTQVGIEVDHQHRESPGLKTERYRQLGVVPVWIISHRRLVHFSQDRLLIPDHQISQLVEGSGYALAINPERRSVAALVPHGLLSGVAGAADRGRLEIHEVSIDQCWIDHDGLHTPITDRARLLWEVHCAWERSLVDIRAREDSLERRGAELDEREGRLRTLEEWIPERRANISRREDELSSVKEVVEAEQRRVASEWRALGESHRLSWGEFEESLTEVVKRWGADDPVRAVSDIQDTMVAASRRIDGPR